MRTASLGFVEVMDVVPGVTTADLHWIIPLTFAFKAEVV